MAGQDSVLNLFFANYESRRTRLHKDAETIRTWLMGEKQLEPSRSLHMVVVPKPEYSTPLHWLRKWRRA